MNYMPPRRSDGTIQHERVRQPWPRDRPFRILSIDGGGIRGILPASILAELERRYLGGAPITTHFDMIAGTSTGGIVALGLAHGLRAADVLELYTERGGSIFPAPSSGIGKALRSLRQIGKPVYDRKPLEDELLKIFGQSVLGEARTRLCIPTFEGTHGEPWIFKTPHHPDYKKDRHERMVRVALATTAAPTYFDAFENHGYRMVDGGIWANNPIMNALVDALACFEIERRQVQILSVGCGEKAFTVSDAQAKGGMYQWRKVFDAAVRAQSQNALGQAFLLVGKDNVLRLDAGAEKDPILLDDYRAARDRLPEVAHSLVEAGGRERSVRSFVRRRSRTSHARFRSRMKDAGAPAIRRAR